MSRPKLWEVHRELSQTYGDLVHLKVLGMRMVVLNSPRAIFGMLEKRSAITSDRQQFHVTPLTGQDFNFSLFPYGNAWRVHRRAFWQGFYPKAIGRYLPIQRDVARQFLRMLLDDPQQYREHIRYTFSATVFKVLYGITVTESEDKRIVLFRTVLESFDAFTPGRFAVSFFPILKHLPEWVPGAGFQKILAHYRSAAHRAKDEYFAEAKEIMKQGNTPVCVVSDLIERSTEDGSALSSEDEDTIKNVALTAFEGGSDTTFSTLQSFFLAMSLYPDVQKRAQEELDAVVGPNRLPDHGDRDALPYVNALIKESLRWMNVLPLSLPHVTTEDQEFDGYFIPSGTIVVANTWACLHDPEVYPEPERFNPDRFLRAGKLAQDVPDPEAFAFGYGRRICPGRHFAEGSLFINIAMVLHVFNIEPPLDHDGRPIVVEPRMCDGLMS
ncbi:cytochrome P450 [Trametes cingulata]|nr:cytochrome P450 [Trametes cingulata]